jgi:hypothetical protein
MKSRLTNMNKKKGLSWELNIRPEPKKLQDEGSLPCSQHFANSPYSAPKLSSHQYHPIFLTYLLTPRSRVLLEKLTGSQLVKKFPAFYGTRRFITAFTNARHLSLSWTTLWLFRNICFYGEESLAPRPIPKLEDHPLSAVRDCLFSIFAATVHIGGRSSIRKLRPRPAVVTGTHLSRTLYLYILIL